MFYTRTRTSYNIVCTATYQQNERHWLHITHVHTHILDPFCLSLSSHCSNSLFPVSNGQIVTSRHNFSFLVFCPWIFMHLSDAKLTVWSDAIQWKSEHNAVETRTRSCTIIFNVAIERSKNETEKRNQISSYSLLHFNENEWTVLYELNRRRREILYRHRCQSTVDNLSGDKLRTK